MKIKKHHIGLTIVIVLLIVAVVYKLMNPDKPVNNDIKDVSKEKVAEDKSKGVTSMPGKEGKPPAKVKVEGTEPDGKPASE